MSFLGNSFRLNLYKPRLKIVARSQNKHKTYMDTRVARLHLEKGKTQSNLSVFVPRDISAKEMAALHEPIVNKIIKDLTGCACLSGAVSVIFQEEFADVIRVDLKSGAILH